MIYLFIPKDKNNIKDNFVNSAGWNPNTPKKGIFGKGEGFKYNHLFAPFIQGEKEGDISQDNIPTIPNVSKNVVEIINRGSDAFSSLW